MNRVMEPSQTRTVAPGHIGSASPVGFFALALTGSNWGQAISSSLRLIDCQRHPADRTESRCRSL